MLPLRVCLQEEIQPQAAAGPTTPEVVPQASVHVCVLWVAWVGGAMGHGHQPLQMTCCARALWSPPLKGLRSFLLARTCSAAQQAQRLAGELERVQRGRAVAELHASQLIGQAHE